VSAGLRDIELQSKSPSDTTTQSLLEATRPSIFPEIGSQLKQSSLAYTRILSAMLSNWCDGETMIPNSSSSVDLMQTYFVVVLSKEELAGKSAESAAHPNEVTSELV